MSNLLFLTKDIGISGINDSHHGHTVKFTACSAKFTVVTSIVVNIALGKESIVLNLRLSKRRSVGSNHHHLSLVGAQGLDGGLVTKSSLTRLHHKLDLTVDGLNSLLSLLNLNRGHF